MAGIIEHEARFYEREAGGLVHCSLCHHSCTLGLNKTGVCGVRSNRDGRLILPHYGHASALSSDPVEKKPLYHFLPGTCTFSIGYVGCNLHCPFCQNYGISQSTDARFQSIDPAVLVQLAINAHCPSIAHTYSEPLIHAEFVIDCMKAAHEAGLYNILVTNGCALKEASLEVLEYCDAVNVDIKAWDNAFYSSELGGDLTTVMDFIGLAIESGVHLEATTLVIPGKNDEDGQILGISAFLASFSKDIPLHLSAYRPMYRYTIPATPVSTISRLTAVARQNLHYVYVGNVAGDSGATVCRHCGAVLVRRKDYIVDVCGLAGTVCSKCGNETPIIVSS